MDTMPDARMPTEICGPDGCAVPGTTGDETSAMATTSTTPAAAPQVGTRIDIVSDAICPWCYVGKRHLEAALAELAAEGLHFSVHWNPFQLNPEMPKEGVARAAYRAAKFGSAERAREIDARVAGAADAAGLSFRQDLMLRTPNTIDAHRLIWFAGEHDRQDATMEAVFRAYFIEGKDIGDTAVLADCAAAAGLDRATTLSFLASGVADAEMRAADRAAREAGVNGVPSFFLDGYNLFSGAMQATQMAEAFRRGRRILAQREA
jgi:predicted DsbA family dithiol-disulfide isomerase